MQGIKAKEVGEVGEVGEVLGGVHGGRYFPFTLFFLHEMHVFDTEITKGYLRY